jgi:hypothetical protein
MCTGNNNREVKGKQGYAGAKRAANWLGYVIVAQVIAHLVRHWLP